MGCNLLLLSQQSQLPPLLSVRSQHPSLLSLQTALPRRRQRLRHAPSGALNVLSVYSGPVQRPQGCLQEEMSQCLNGAQMPVAAAAWFKLGLGLVMRGLSTPPGLNLSVPSLGARSGAIILSIGPWALIPSNGAGPNLGVGEAVGGEAVDGWGPIWVGCVHRPEIISSPRTCSSSNSPRSTHQRTRWWSCRRLTPVWKRQFGCRSSTISVHQIWSRCVLNLC